MYLKNYAIQVGKDILIRFPKKVARFFTYVGELRRFRNKNDKRFSIKTRDLYPFLKDSITKTPFDQHYTYHPAWAARILARTKPEYHVDISSILYFGTMLSAFIPVKFYDYRPADIKLDGYETGFADLKQLPFSDGSIPSLSCMHTIEHVGLGRYGDALDPDGDLTSILELIRVLAKGGHLLFVVPVGKAKIVFNGHRIYSFEQIISYFAGIELIEFSLVPDKGGLIINADPQLVKEQDYGCGCFLFRKNN